MEALGVACTPDAGAVLKRLSQLSSTNANPGLPVVAKLYTQLAKCLREKDSAAGMTHERLVAMFQAQPLVYVPPPK